MFETYRMLGTEHEADLVRETQRLQRRPRIVRSAGKAPARTAKVVGLAFLSAALLVTAARASDVSSARLRTTPAWARPLSGVRPYLVQRAVGTSGNLTCDLRVYTTNAAAL